MALSKANKAIFRAKYGEQMYEAMIAAENVIVTDEGVEKSLADVILSLALKTEIPTNNNELTNGAGYQTASDVASAINTKIASVYKPGGSYAFASLPALTEANEGYIYNVTDDFTTTADFLEGAGKSHNAGADVGVVAVKDGENTVYKYNVFANFVDLSGYVEKENGKGLSTNDYDDAEKQKVADSKTVTDKLASNADVLKDISSADVTKWNGAGHIYASTAQPENLKSGDLWLQTFEE